MGSKHELLGRRGALSAGISGIKRQLSSLASERRRLFSERDSLRASFFQLIDKVKELRKKRDEHTSAVKSLKDKRQSAFSVVRNASSEVTKLRVEREKRAKALGVKKSASAIASDIARLEFKIETVPMPFEHEQRLTKLIKEKKSEFKTARQLSDVLEKLRASSIEMQSSKSVSDSAHKELQLHASVSQKLHEDMLSFAGKADEVKVKLAPVDARISELSRDLASLRKELEQKLGELAVVNQELDGLSVEEKKQKQLEEAQRIEKVESELAAKMRSGRKLTTNDLIMLRGS